MAKISVNPLLRLISKRCYRAGVEYGRSGVAESTVVGESVRSGEEVAVKEAVFWMRDPKTGNWIPENRFGEIDVAELRNKYLSNPQNKLTPTKLD